MDKKTETPEEKDLKERREQMAKESWVKNVLRIYPEKTQEEVEKLWNDLKCSESVGGEPK